MPVRLVTVIPPAGSAVWAAAAGGAFLFPFPGDGPVSYWVEVGLWEAAQRQKRDRAHEETSRRLQRWMCHKRALFSQVRSAWGLPDALALCESFAFVLENEPLAQT